MKMIQWLILVVLMSVMVYSKVEYTETTRTECGDKTCTKTLYGGTRYVFEDNEWKPIEQARSLKGYYTVAYLEQDGEHFVYVEDFNWTSVKMVLSFQGKPKDYEYEVDGDKIKAKYKILTPEGEIEYEIELEGDYTSFEYKGNLMNDVFKFGGNSTTIMLQDANSENLDDTYLYKLLPDRAYGDSSQIYISNNSWTHGVLRFDITQIPANQNITNAVLGLYVISNLLDAGESYNITTYRLNQYPLFHVDDLEWTEGIYDTSAEPGEITWNHKPNSNNLTNKSQSIKYIQGNGLGWNIFNVFDIILTDYDLGYSNSSIYLLPEIEGVSGGLTDYINISSKENSETTKRPYLNVTYQAFAGADSCTYEPGSDWVMDCSDNCVVTGDQDLGGYSLYITGTGEVVFNDKVVNYNRLYLRGTDSTNICKVRFI